MRGAVEDEEDSICSGEDDEHGTDDDTISILLVWLL